MGTKFKFLTLCFLISSASFVEAVSQVQTPSTKDGKNKPVAKSEPLHEGEGTRIFDQNCSRCHNTPEGFSPRISGTIVQHMRVRASLSKEDERQLLRFLNP